MHRHATWVNAHPWYRLAKMLLYLSNAYTNIIRFYVAKSFNIFLFSRPSGQIPNIPLFQSSPVIYKRPWLCFSSFPFSSCQGVEDLICTTTECALRCTKGILVIWFIPKFTTHGLFYTLACIFCNNRNIFSKSAQLNITACLGASLSTL